MENGDGRIGMDNTESLFDEKWLRTCILRHFRNINSVKLAVRKVVLWGK
jgi:hypothetical protein